MSVNKIILLGFVGADPDLRFPEKDSAVAAFPLATSEMRGSPAVEITEWHRVVMYGDNARFAEKYIRKGSRLFVEGKLMYREFEDKFKIRHKIAEIKAENFEILGRKL